MARKNKGLGPIPKLRPVKIRKEPPKPKPIWFSDRSVLDPPRPKPRRRDLDE
jgi:hypothetical protein